MLTGRVRGKPTADIFKEQENEKKQKYKQRVLDVEMGSFTAFVFGTNGGMGGECQIFLRQIAEKLAKKNDENRDKGASSWLNAIPLEEQDLVLNKQEFRDSVQNALKYAIVWPTKSMCLWKSFLNWSCPFG